LDPTDVHDDLCGLLEQCADGRQLRQVAGQCVVLLEPTPLGPPLAAPWAGRLVERGDDGAHETLLVVEADDLVPLSSALAREARAGTG
jgi:hypothetical protein